MDFTRDSEDKPGVSRRQALLMGAAAAVAALPGASAAEGQKLAVRKAWNLLGEQEIASIRRGVQAMKDRDAADPTSWWYQANIHGTYNAAVNALAKKTWNTCPHGGYFFLPWHRAFLYYFERILRAAAQDPALTLPYWNYTNQKYLAMPQAFLKPASASNSLWWQDRIPYQDSEAGINVNVGAGDPMPWSLIDPSADWKFENFCVADGRNNSFGSTKGPWHHLPPPPGFGALETQPHNNVHNLVGGYIPDAQANGAMTDVNKATNDPIFWFHHGNIDRLWAYWISLRGQRSDPIAEADWVSYEFTFVDEKGAPVITRPKDMLSTEKLGYVYDALDPQGPPEPRAEAQATPASAPIVACTPGPVTVETLARAGGEGAPPALAFSVGRATASLAPSAGLFAAPAPGAPTPRTKLVLEGIDMPAQSAIIGVYVNLPPGAKADVNGPYFAGAVSFFGLAQSSERARFDKVIDITDLLRRQQEAGIYKEGPVTVTAAGAVPKGVTVSTVRIER